MNTMREHHDLIKGTSMGKAHVNHIPIRQLPCVGEHVGRSCLIWEDTQNLTDSSP